MKSKLYAHLYENLWALMERLDNGEVLCLDVYTTREGARRAARFLNEGLLNKPYFTRKYIYCAS